MTNHFHKCVIIVTLLVFMGLLTDCRYPGKELWAETIVPNAPEVTCVEEYLDEAPYIGTLELKNENTIVYQLEIPKEVAIESPKIFFMFKVPKKKEKENEKVFLAVDWHASSSGMHTPHNMTTSIAWRGRQSKAFLAFGRSYIAKNHANVVRECSGLDAADIKMEWSSRPKGLAKKSERLVGMQED